MNEIIFREMNEWTEEVADAQRLGTGGHPMETYLCDCSDRTCAEPISLTPRARVHSVGVRPVRHRRPRGYPQED